jgi:hypothetical protein
MTQFINFKDFAMSTRRTSIGIAALLLGTLLLSHWGLAKDDTPPVASEKQVDKAAVAESTTENILHNPSFEEGDTSPAKWTSGAKIEGVTYLWEKKNGKTGKSSLCLKKTANRYFPIAQWFQIVDKKSDHKSLKVSSQVKAENAHKAIIDVIFLDEKGEWISHEWSSFIGIKQNGDKAASHDWKEYVGEVKIPPETKKIQIGLQIYGPGKVWFDDIRAEYVD